MADLSQVLAGSRILAALIAAVAPNAAFKGADESVTSSTTLQNDDALFLQLTANSTWIFIGFASLTGAAIGSGDFKGQFTAPSGSTVVVEAIGYSTSSAGPLNGNAVRAASATFTAGINGATASPLLLIGSVIVGNTSGNLQLQWAENTSSGTPTVVKAGAFLAAWQVA